MTRRRSTAVGHAPVALAVGQVVGGGLVATLADSPIVQADRPGEPATTPQGCTSALRGLVELLSLMPAVRLVWFRRRAADGALLVLRRSPPPPGPTLGARPSSGRHPWP